MIRLLAALIGLALIAGGVVVAMPPDGWSSLESRAAGSLRFEDRKGVLLREVPIGGSRSRWVRLSEMPPWVGTAIIAAEDRRFARHAGVDPVAVVRALSDNRRAGRIVSGASTITMQVARLAAGRPPGGSWGMKACEMLNAVRLEQRLTKEEILEHYLNRAAFGRGAVGIEGAALAWFGHSARTLTPSEASGLAVLPRAPERLSRPAAREGLERHRQALVAALRRSRPVASPDEPAWNGALEPPLLAPRPAPPFEAPHLTSWLLESLPAAVRTRAGVIRTTLDHPLQAEIGRRLAPRLERLADKGARQAAVVVLDNRTRELVVLLGSVDFFDPEVGQVNGALARRQPGSTLKPFTYALAFESGLTPASLVDDDPRDFPAAGGPFAPRNYGGVSFGQVRIRDALAGSLNIAAVDALSRVGADRLFGRLVGLGLLEAGQAADEPGLGLTLGVAEVRLIDLANAYVTLARGGRHGQPVVVRSVRDAVGRELPLPSRAPEPRLIDPVAAWWIADILADDDARLRSFGRRGVLDMPWPVSVKTGTSSDWRDNWAIGYTTEWTVGVWVGDFTGAPMHQVSGVFGAAPLLRDIFGLLAARGELTAPPHPAGLAPSVRCLDSGEPARPACPGSVVEWLRPDEEEWPCRQHAGEVMMTSGGVARGPRLAVSHGGGVNVSGAPPSARLAITRPVPGDVFFLDPAIPRSSQVLRLEAQGPATGLLTWRVDGRTIGVTATPHRINWSIESGSHRVEIEAGETRASAGFSVLAAPATGAIPTSGAGVAVPGGP